MNEPTPGPDEDRPSDRDNLTTTADDTSISGVDFWPFDWSTASRSLARKPKYNDRTITAICSDKSGLYVAWRKPGPAAARQDPETDWCSATTDKGTRCLLDATRDGLCKLHWRKANDTPSRRPLSGRIA